MMRIGSGWQERQVRRMRAVWSVLVGGLLACSGAGAAWAGDPDQPDPNRHYWYEEQQVAWAQTEGIYGRVPVAVVDLAVRADLPELADARLTVREPSYCAEKWLVDHGREPYPASRSTVSWDSTARLAFIVGNGQDADGQESVRGVAPGADIRFYAVGVDSPVFNGRCTGVLSEELDREAEAATALAIVQAVGDGARIIALYDQGVRADQRVAEAVAYAVHEKVVLVVPSSSVYGGDWIQSLNGVVSVAAISKEGWWSGASLDTTVFAPGVDILFPVVPRHSKEPSHNLGSSWEVPAWLVAGMLADVADAFPEATGDQLVQTLVANAVPQSPPPPGREGDLYYEKRGHGLADLQRMLVVDPTQYPDVNPLIVPDDQRKHGLTEQDIRTAGHPAWAPPLPGAEPTVVAVISGSPGPARWVMLALGAVVVVAAGAVGVGTWSGARRKIQDKNSPAEKDE